MRRAKWLALRIRILLTSLKTYNHISIWEINLSSSAYRNWKPLFSLSWAWTNVRQTLGSHINKVSCCYLCNCYNTGYVGCCVVVRSLNHVQPHGLQHARLPCPSPTPRACSNSCPSSGWCPPTISFSVAAFSSCLQCFPSSGSFPVSQFFSSGGHSIGASASASILPMNIQDWFPLGWTGLISFQSKGLLRVFPTPQTLSLLQHHPVQKHQFFHIQLNVLITIELYT